MTYGEKNGRKQVCVVLRVPGAVKCYEETALLMNYGFDNFSQVNLVSDELEPTFYEAMKLNYVGMSKKYFRSGLLDQTVGKIISGVVTVPNTVTHADLSVKSESSGQTTLLTYLYHEWPVGSAVIELHEMPADTQLPFEQELDMEALLKNSSMLRVRNEIEQTAMVVYNRSKEIVNKAYSVTMEFTEKNKLMVLLGGCFLLIVLLVIIMILIIRCTREARIQKRRRQEEKERLRKAEEIDQMTTAEIEQELRMAMEQERRKREQEAAKAEEQRIQEEKLRETELILEEINKKN